MNPDLVALIAEESANEVEHCSRRLELLSDCLQQLPDARRALVMQTYQPGCSIQNLAEEVGKTRDGMYQMLRRIRVTLMKCVENGMAEGGEA